MRTRTLVIAAFPIVAFVTGCPPESGDLFTSAGGPSHEVVCTPGKQIACPCQNGLDGAQRCADDGSKYESCEGCDVAPSGSSSSSSGGGTGGGHGGAGGGSGGTGGVAVPCYTCACQKTLSFGGCADFCAMGVNGTTTPNFCDGVPALALCAMCIVNNCGSTPQDCH